MSDDSQIIIPPSFIALFVPAGQIRPHASRAEIASRHDFCEDLATLLTETAATQQWQRGAAPLEVLQHMHRGLLSDDAVVSAAEAEWVVRRLAELLDWAQPAPGALAPGPNVGHHGP